MKQLPCPPEHWPEFSRLLDEAFELPAPDRDVWLGQLATQHAHLKPWLADVLKADVQVRTKNFLERPHFPDVAEGDSAFTTGQPIGPYRLAEPLGRGGMGEVWKARRIDGALDRTVALKLPHFWIFASGMRQRLHRERDILASLSHPHIAQLHDAGVTGEGQPYLALELVDGEPIDAYCRTQALTIEARVVLFGQVLDAVRYAHSQLIVHRDLKPSNILVTADGQVKLLDFGIAKLLEPGGDGSATELTRAAGRAMTPEYAAPEQISGDPVSVATDVFALGVILFQLLAGKRPFGRERPSEVPIASASIYPEHIGEVRCGDVRALRRQIEGDLDAILARCLAPTPADRYASVEQLAEDLHRHLRLEPIRARRISRFERGLRFVRRNRLAVGMSTALVLVVAAGVTGVVLQTLRAQESAVRARNQAQRADLTRNFMFDMLIANDTRIPADQRRDRIPAGDLLAYGIDHIHEDFSKDPAAQLELLQLGATIYNFWGQPERRAELLRQRAAIAEKAYGRLHPAVIESLIVNADEARARGESQAVQALLRDADSRIRDAGLDQSALRADWWEAQFYATPLTPEHIPRQIDTLKKTVELAARFRPDDATATTARFNLGSLYYTTGRFEDAEATVLQAIEELRRSRRIDRRSFYLATGYRLLASIRSSTGNLDGAEEAWSRAAAPQDDALAGFEDNSAALLAYHAWFVELRGDSSRAHRLLEQARVRGERPSTSPTSRLVIPMIRGYCAAIEGRAAEALSFLLPIRSALAAGEPADYLEYLQFLGVAFDGAGRPEEARKAFDEAAGLARDRALATTSAALLVRERRARFLSSRGESKEAMDEFARIAEQARDPDRSPAALALGGLARGALAAGDVPGALSTSAKALTTLEQSRALFDARYWTYLWGVRADALRASGDGPAAALLEQRIRESVDRDAPAVSEIPSSSGPSAHRPIGQSPFHPPTDPQEHRHERTEPSASG